MKTKFKALLLSLLLGLLFAACGSKKSLTIDSAKTEDDCKKSGGYWYNGKCWSGFKDEGIKATDIDRIVDEQIKLINNASISYDGKTYPILSANGAPQKDLLVLFVNFIDKEHTILVSMKKADVDAKKEIKAGAAMIIGDMNDATNVEQRMLAKGQLIGKSNGGELDFSFTGTFTSTKDTTKKFPVSFTINDAITGAGSSTLEVKGTEAHLNGDLGTVAYKQMKDLIKNHPEVKTIVLGKISGSVNDAVNMHTGRILRETGLTTKVLASSDIASGGVDLFCAGKERIVHKGAKIGIHSWCCVNDYTAQQLPKEHPAHQYQIEYFKMCLGDLLGTSFYFHTLTSAPFDGIHYMSDADIKKWEVATKFVD